MMSGSTNPAPYIKNPLDPLLGVLRSKWVRSFLFTPSPIHMPYLLSSQFHSNALTLFFSTGSAALPATLPTPPVPLGDSHHVAGPMLCLPAFATDGTTVGVGVLHSTANVDAPWLRNFGESQVAAVHTRFARDNASRTLLQVYDIAQDDCFFVCSSHVETPTIVRYFVGVFQRGPLRDAMLGSEEPLSIDHLHGLILAEAQVHSRDCAVCGATIDANCGCQLDDRTPLHPFDGTFFSTTMLQHLSSSQPLVSKVMYAFGRKENLEAKGSWKRIRITTDRGVLKKLISSALAEYYKGEQLDPLHSLLSAEGEAATQVQRNCNRASTSPESSTSPARDDAEEPVVSLSAILGLESSTFLNDTPSEGFDSLALSADQPSRRQPTHEMEQNLPDVLESASNLTPQLSTSDGDDRWWAQKLSKVPKQFLAADSSEVANPKSSDLTSSPFIPMPVSGRDTNMMITKPVTKRRMNQRTATTDEARQKRLLERQERNRESARLCNMRNKMMRESLKLSLTRNHEKINLLRQRELELRKENLNLRRVFGQQQFDSAA